MEYITDAMEMVDHVVQPAFCVREGTIVKVNPAAAARMIEPGRKISEILKTGSEEYAAFTDGCLYLTLSLCAGNCGAAVIRKKDFDLFLLEQEAEQDGLQAMALAARELREPLSSIMISAERIFPSIDPEDSKMRDHAARINRGLFQMLRMISNMADANRYATHAESRQEMVDLSAFLGEIVSKASALAEHTGIRLNARLHPEPVWSLADSEKLERAAYNIISNALKFAPENSTVDISLVRRGNKLCFSVSDKGPGIPEQVRSTLFSRYVREPALEDGRYGIGLGLVLIRSAAALHGGTVLVDHPEGTGTRVTITLAICPGTADTLASPKMRVDYAGEWDHGLLELSNSLPAALYNPQK